MQPKAGTPYVYEWSENPGCFKHIPDWMPAFAGMTGANAHSNLSRFCISIIYAFSVYNAAGFNPHKNQSIPALAGLDTKDLEKLTSSSR
jgi:hypothetical protein